MTPSLRVGDNCIHTKAPKFYNDGKTPLPQDPFCVHRIVGDRALVNGVHNGVYFSSNLPLSELAAADPRDAKEMKGSSLRPLDAVRVTWFRDITSEGRLGGVFAGTFFKLFEKTKNGIVCHVIEPAPWYAEPIKEFKNGDPLEELLKLRPELKRS